MATLLQASDLRAGYGGGDVLQGVDVAVAAGEIVAVIGRNGVGKTTLMRTLIGLLPARTGVVRLQAADITREPAHRRARRGIGYVPQGREIFGHMTVLDNLRMGRPIDAAGAGLRLDEVYGHFPFLRERRDQRAGTLSGGQQAMLAIGRALVGAPALLLLDEPSDGVQPSIIQAIGDFLLALVKARPIGILFVEQNIDLMQTVAGRAYAMDKGRIVAELDRAALRDTATLVRHLAL
jgi:branched-chain amino acid transport system ATP-binding protein